MRENALNLQVDNATGPDAWPSELPFNQLPEVIMTPHLAQKTNVEASARIAELAQQLDRLARNEQPENLLRPGANIDIKTPFVAAISY